MELKQDLEEGEKLRRILSRNCHKLKYKLLDCTAGAGEEDGAAVLGAHNIFKLNKMGRGEGGGGGKQPQASQPARPHNSPTEAII